MTWILQVDLLQHLRHRNIVQFYGACLEPDCFFIVTELLAGAPDIYPAAVAALQLKMACLSSLTGHV